MQLDRIEQKLDRIMDKVSEQTVYLARVDERLKSLEADFEVHVEDDRKIATKLNHLERWYWSVLGGSAVVTFGIQFLLKMVK
jgi:septation ring formation regulator EzrA